jgi:mono/diheme cytochrome c family protein
MFRIGMLGTAAWLAATAAASAQTAVERGSYLVNTVMSCGNCHTPKGAKGEPQADKAFSGGLSFDTPGFKVTAPNITQDPETGIGKWSDADIKRLLLEGVRPNGVSVAPIMPSAFYKVLTVRDLDAIVVYLKTVKPVKNQSPAPVYLTAFGHPEIPNAGKPMAEGDLRDQVKRGFYLATIGHCFECHTPMVKGQRDFVNDYGKGGFKMEGPWGETISANITPHQTKGIGAWTDAEIKRAITQGISRDGRRLRPPMDFGAYSKFTEADLSAIVAYLRTVPQKE